MKKLLRDKSIVSWALYDWANSAFATTVMAGFFPLFFKQYWSAGLEPGESTYHLGIANSAASLVIAVTAPFLGAMADYGRRKKHYLFLFACLGVTCTAGLHFVTAGQWPFAALLYALAFIGFSGSNIFYDALIVDVSDDSNVDSVSGLGYSLGYLGGGLLFVINVLMTQKPEWFGLNDAAEGVLWSFLTVSLWWALFSVPLFKNVHEVPSAKTEVSPSFRDVFAGVRVSLKKIRSSRTLLFFLLGFMLYNDGVNTIIKMAVDYGMALGFPSDSLIKALLLTQFVGFPSAMAFGYLGQQFHPKIGVMFCLLIYMGVTVWGYFLENVAEFYALAIAIGLVQGGIQALSRSQFTRIIPKDSEAEYFGFYNTLGKFSAVLGPALVGLTSYLTGSPRLSILVIIVFFVAGGFLFYKHDLLPKEG